MNFVLPTPSLEHLAGVKIVANLWNEREIFTQMTRSFSRQSVYGLSERSKEYKAVEEKVTKNVWTLPLIPITCRENLLNLIKPLGMEIVHWSHYHTLRGNTSQGLKLVPFPPMHFCWTMHGTVDYAQTAELMVKDEGLDVESRYIVSCFNSFENEARELIKLIPADRRRKLINKVIHDLGMAHRNLIVYFTCILSGDMDQLNSYFETIVIQEESINKYLFKVTLRSGNRAACEYFYAKLSRREKVLVCGERVARVFGKFSRLPAPCNVLYYLSLMNEAQRRRVFRRDICGLLQCFLGWPRQTLFMAAAKRGWQLMDTRNCTKVLVAICDQIGLGFRDYDYFRWFGECWRLTSVGDRGLVLANVNFLKSVFQSKREELIIFIVNQVHSDRIGGFLYTMPEEIKQVLFDESIMSDAALMECKQTAALNSSNEPEDKEKRFKSQHVNILVDMVMESRTNERLQASNWREAKRLRSEHLDRLVAMAMENRKKRRDAACLKRTEFFLADF